MLEGSKTFESLRDAEIMLMTKKTTLKLTQYSLQVYPRIPSVHYLFASLPGGYHTEKDDDGTQPEWSIQ